MLGKQQRRAGERSKKPAPEVLMAFRDWSIVMDEEDPHGPSLTSSVYRVAGACGDAPKQISVRALAGNQVYILVWP